MYRLLLSGYDTIECAYYLAFGQGCLLNFEQLAAEKEALRQLKTRTPKPVKLGNEEFLLASHGTSSGYPFLIENESFSIQFGEFNQPSFFVTFRSVALWHTGIQGLHQLFLDWAQSVGLFVYQPERLSRVDLTFDYSLPDIDFDEDSFVTVAIKDNQHRKNRKVQTFSFGEGDIKLRVYNKCDEIKEKSAKSWFYDLWGMDHDVWRIEWQVRKSSLRGCGICTFEDLQQRQGILLRVLVNDHTTLRIKADDCNRSRWALHPLWQDLIEQVARIEILDSMDTVHDLDMNALLEERKMRMAISVYGYLKRIAAIHSLQSGKERVTVTEAQALLNMVIRHVHDPLSWPFDVEKRVTEMRLGQW
jgi:hypothetical protein